MCFALFAVFRLTRTRAAQCGWWLDTVYVDRMARHSAAQLIQTDMPVRSRTTIATFPCGQNEILYAERISLYSGSSKPLAHLYA